MNPYPAKHSVLVMDNARIHHNDNLIRAVEEMGGRILYLPPYSPDYNPIEFVFLTVKSWLKKYRDFLNHFNNPSYVLLVALAQITSDMAKGYFKKSIYL